MEPDNFLLRFHLDGTLATTFVVCIVACGTYQTVNPNQSEENKEIRYSYLLKLFKQWQDEKIL